MKTQVKIIAILCMCLAYSCAVEQESSQYAGGGTKEVYIKYRNGHSIYKNYYPDGILREYFRDRGMIIYTTYYPNGLKKSQYSRSRSDLVTFSLFDENGNLLQKARGYSLITNNTYNSEGKMIIQEISTNLEPDPLYNVADKLQP